MSDPFKMQISTTLDGVNVEATGIKVGDGKRFEGWQFSAIMLCGRIFSGGEWNETVELYGELLFRRDVHQGHAYVEWRSNMIFDDKGSDVLIAFSTLHNIDLARRAIETQIPAAFHQQGHGPNEVDAEFTSEFTEN